ncbi:hypothetical protein ABZ749_11335, partial [Micromonospora sp. NPDC047753]
MLGALAAAAVVGASILTMVRPGLGWLVAALAVTAALGTASVVRSGRPSPTASAITATGAAVPPGPTAAPEPTVQADPAAAPERTVQADPAAAPEPTAQAATARPGGTGTGVHLLAVLPDLGELGVHGAPRRGGLVPRRG